ncbi:uncharacterized protein VTP21DRAFT_10850 [Calcarisporiella thermophila]|uniref:uncharacterized protein n=1 Tax=Calcarisporiella thermophila TaxID=911321 RepID=UPI0037441A94
MSNRDYSAIIQEDEDLSKPIQPDTTGNELEFQDFSGHSTTGIQGGRITPNRTAPSAPAPGFSDPGFFDPHRQIQQENRNHGFWTIEYYSKYFDIDTVQVIERCLKSLYPRDNFLEVINNNPDLYGPFWIPTTVIFSLFVTSSIAGSIAAYLADTSSQYNYDFSMLSFALIAVYVYSFAIPLCVWGMTKYYGCQPSLLEMICLYGYGMTVWIPVSALCVIPVEILRWTLTAVAFGTSATFLVRNMYPVISRTDAKTSRIILILMLAAHGAFALLLKFEFFSYSIKAPEKAPGASN